jgi:phosphatidate phosphatase APP1
MTAWNKILHWSGMEGRPHIRVYNGFGGAEYLEIYGHVLAMGPRPITRYSRFFLVNMFALLRLFWVKPLAGIKVMLEWEGMPVTAITEKDGFFHLQWQPVTMPAAGKYNVQVKIMDVADSPVSEAPGVVIIPHHTQFGCISDIDDTFLVSHSAKIIKRLQVLFTRNARTRKPFEGVVRHYQLLSHNNNPFFYVSSSEWNLYAYIREFIRYNGLPDGVFLLSQLKPLRQLLKSGQNKHSTKFIRITRILKHYPDMRFVLLGDDTQEDPNIYKALVDHFGTQIIAVYLRRVRDSKAVATREVVQAIQDKGIAVCYFEHSEEGIAHSQRIGLI